MAEEKIAFRQNVGAQKTLFAVVFSALVLGVLGYFELGGFDDIKKFVGSGSSSAPPSEAFDPSVPVGKRVEIIKSYLAGEWHEPPIVNDSAASHTNYTFGKDGSLKAWQCDRWGEPSERKYRPFDHDGAVHTFTVEEDRYAADGRIFYNVIRGDGILWGYPKLIIDRQKGFVEYLPRDDISKPLDRGHSTDCT